MLPFLIAVVRNHPNSIANKKATLANEKILKRTNIAVEDTNWLFF